MALKNSFHVKSSNVYCKIYLWSCVTIKNREIGNKGQLVPDRILPPTN